jgi:nucleoside transporter
MSSQPAAPPPPSAALPPPAPRLGFGLRLRLSAMMFLQSAAPGTFWPIMGRYLRDGLGFDAGDVGRIYATLAVGAMVSPMIVGPLADRYFAADRMLAALHLGAALLLVAPAQFEPGTELAGLSGPGLYWWAMLAFALVFQPTWVLAYSVCFRHLPDARRDMPGIRVIGTVGWVVAGLLIGPLLGEGAEATGRPLLMGAAFAGALAVLSLTVLPPTPAVGRAGDPLPFRKALALLGDVRFAAFFAAAFLINWASAFYYPYMSVFLRAEGYVNTAATMTVGQVSETVLMPLLPLMLLRFGFRTTLVIGASAWVVRYALFAGVAEAESLPLLGTVTVLAGVFLHGPCIGFYREGCFLYVKERSPLEIRNSAQALFLLMSDGLASLLGAELSGRIVAAHTDPATRLVDWSAVWLYPAVGAAVGVALLVWSVRERPAE